MKLDWLHWLLISSLLALGAVVYFTPYSYERWGSGLVRIHRLTGDTERLVPSGWRPMVAPSQFDARTFEPKH